MKMKIDVNRDEKDFDQKEFFFLLEQEMELFSLLIKGELLV